MLSRSLVAAAAKPIILSILKKGRSYGYAIIQEIRDRSSEDMQWAEGSLYPVLHKLEKEGMITSQWALSEEGRNRKYYHISEKGKQALVAEQENWSNAYHLLSRFWTIELKNS